MRPFATDEQLTELDGPGGWLPGDPRTRAVIASTVRIRARGVSELRYALRDAEADVRMFTCMSLWKLGTHPLPALPDLERLREDASPAVGFWASAAIERVSVSARAIVRRIAARMQPSSSSDARDLESLVRELDAPDVWAQLTPGRLEWPNESDRRWDACREILAHWLPTLEEREHAPSEGERESARAALARVEWETMLHLERVFRVLGNEWDVGMRAAREHVELGPAILPVLADDPFRHEHYGLAPCIYASSIWVLEQLGDDALPLLAMGLEHWGVWARPWCAQAIFARGEAALPLIPAIVSAWRTLDDDPGGPGPGVYWDVEQTPFYGPSAWTDVPTHTADGKPWTMKISDARGLARLGAGAVAPLLRALDDPHPRVRARAAHALSAFKIETSTIRSHLTQKRNDEDRDVRACAARALAAIADARSFPTQEAERGARTPASNAAPNGLDLDDPGAIAWRIRDDPLTEWADFHARFRRLFEHYGVEQHVTAVRMLQAIEDLGPSAITQIPFLLDKTEHVQVDAAWLARDAATARRAPQMLNEAMAHALRAMGAPGAKYLAQRAIEITDRDATPRRAREWLPRVRWTGEHTIEQLFGSFPRIDERMQPWIALAISNCGPLACETVFDELASDDPARRPSAIRIVRAFAESQELVAPLVRPLLDSEDAAERACAAFTLGGLTPASLPMLLDALVHRDADVRAIAAEAIEKATPLQLGPTAKDFGILRSADPYADEARLRAITSPRGLTVLGRALSDADERVRVFAAMSLWKLGTAATPARDALRAAEHDASRAVRVWARSAHERTFDSSRATLHRLARAWRVSVGTTSVSSDERARLVRELDAPNAWRPGQRVRALLVDRRFDALKALVTDSLAQLETDERSEDASVASSARDALSKLEREADAYLTRLGDQLEVWVGFDANEPTELVALSGAALPTMTDHLFRDVPTSHDKYEHHVAALIALGDEGLPALAIGLEHLSEVGRVWCAQALARLGERAAPAALALVSAWRSVGEDVRAPGTQLFWLVDQVPYYDNGIDAAPSMRAAHLGAFGKLASANLEPFVEALRDAQPVVRAHAARVSRTASFDSVACFIPEIERLLDDPCESVRRAAAGALVTLVPESLAGARARAILASARAR